MNNRSLFMSFSAMVVLLIVLALPCFAEVTILVNPAGFQSIEKAAAGENTVNFWDNDLSDDRACTECFAALELAKFLNKCADIGSVQVKPANELPANGDIFILGSRNSNILLASFNMNEAVKLETDESFNIRTVKDSNRLITIIEGRDRVGVLYGVYEYLKALGINFIGLGETGTVYPPVKVKLVEDLNITQNPSFLSRGYHAWEDRKPSEDFFLWMARNKVNFWTAADQPVNFLKKLGMKLAWGDHDMQSFYIDPNAVYPYNHQNFDTDNDKPQDPYKIDDQYKGDVDGDGKLSYFEAHPQWYGLYAGQRHKLGPLCLGYNFCTSNDDAVNEYFKNLIQSIIDGKYKYIDILKFHMIDLGKWCQCEKCQAQGTYTDRLLVLCDKFMKALKKAQADGTLKRNILVISSAYTETLPPPTKPLPEDFDYANFTMVMYPIERCYAHSFADPACSEINRKLVESYQGWTVGENRNYKGSLMIGEYYNVSLLKSLPALYTKIIATDLPWYYNAGTRHFVYMHVLTDLWGTWTLNQHMLSEFMWNVNTDPDKLLNDYYSLYYPTTKDITRKFYENLEEATRSIKVFKHFVRLYDRSNYTLNKWPAVEGLQTEQNRLLDPKAEIFNLEHFKYDPYHPAVNDGPDVVEIMDSMALARKYIDDALIKCTDKTEQLRLIDDEKRFRYGELMFDFYYHIIRTAMFHHRNDEMMAKREFAILRQCAEQLKLIVDVIQVASEDANDENGFKASKLTEVYDEFEKMYGK
ncbi:MAG TPA: DUF4838 domain-containing protein [Sedimentisphaerales bacterium]|nr:DUF4838 domain-containing protein [Sedimentisphaerales bacterium]